MFCRSALFHPRPGAWWSCFEECDRLIVKRVGSGGRVEIWNNANPGQLWQLVLSLEARTTKTKLCASFPWSLRFSPDDLGHIKHHCGKNNNFEYFLYTHVVSPDTVNFVGRTKAEEMRPCGEGEWGVWECRGHIRGSEVMAMICLCECHPVFPTWWEPWKIKPVGTFWSLQQKYLGVYLSSTVLPNHGAERIQGHVSGVWYIETC